MEKNEKKNEKRRENKEVHDNIVHLNEDFRKALNNFCDTKKKEDEKFTQGVFAKEYLQISPSRLSRLKHANDSEPTLREAKIIALMSKYGGSIDDFLAQRKQNHKIMLNTYNDLFDILEKFNEVFGKDFMVFRHESKKRKGHSYWVIRLSDEKDEVNEVLEQFSLSCRLKGEDSTKEIRKQYGNKAIKKPSAIEEKE